MNSDGLVERIKQITEGMSDRNFAQSAGLNPSTFRSVKTGSSPTLETLLSICRAANVNVGWLATGEGPMRPGEQGTQKSAEYVGIPRYDAALSAGDGRWNEDSATVLDHIPFTQEFMRKRLGRSSAEGLLILSARGDSMEPQISDGDLVMVDQAKNELIEGIFAIILNGMARVKRLRQLANGDIVLISLNKEYDDEILQKGDMHDFQIIGKVVWCGHHFAR